MKQKCLQHEKLMTKKKLMIFDVTHKRLEEDGEKEKAKEKAKQDMSFLVGTINFRHKRRIITTQCASTQCACSRRQKYSRNNLLWRF